MANSEKFVIVPKIDTTYDGYLNILKEANMTGKMVPTGNIVFPFPSSFEEYEMLAGTKAQILDYLLSQQAHGIEIKHLVFLSLELTNEIKKRYSWDSIDSADYTLILFSNNFENKHWGTVSQTMVETVADTFRSNKIKQDIIIFFDEDNTDHNWALSEILPFGTKDEDEEYNGKILSAIRVPSARILGISW